MWNRLTGRISERYQAVGVGVLLVTLNPVLLLSPQPAHFLSCVFWRTSSCILSVALETLSSFHKCVLAVQVLRFPPIRSGACKHTSACPSASVPIRVYFLFHAAWSVNLHFCLIMQQSSGACGPRICGDMKLVCFCNMNFMLWKSVLAPLNPAQTNRLHKTTEGGKVQWMSPLSLSSPQGRVLVPILTRNMT